MFLVYQEPKMRRVQTNLGWNQGRNRRVSIHQTVGRLFASFLFTNSSLNNSKYFRNNTFAHNRIRFITSSPLLESVNSLLVEYGLAENSGRTSNLLVQLLQMYCAIHSRSSFELLWVVLLGVLSISLLAHGVNLFYKWASILRNYSFSS